MATVKQYEKIISDFSEKRKQILIKLYQFGPFPDSNDIAQILGYRNFNAANLQIGTMGRIIAEKTGFIPGVYTHKGKERPAFFAFIHDYKKDGWELIKNLEKAIENLGWIEDKDDVSDIERFNTEISRNEEKLYKEGKAIKIFVNKFERDRNLVKECIKIHGRICAGCKMSFKDKYGEDIIDIVHVHHKKPLSEIRGEKYKNPIKDLVPLCPNCHAVVHSVMPVMDIEQLKERIKRQKN